MGASKAFTARIPHTCETCSVKTVNGTYTEPIRPGHRYLVHVVFPGEESFEEITRPWKAAECGTCAIARDDFVAHSFGICGSYCCGVNPCVLPFENIGAPGHDHQCRECSRLVAR
jgi:hypothetical protein